MVHQITITPLGEGTHTTRLGGRYFDTKLKQYVTLTIPYGIATGRALTPNEKEWKHWFNTASKSFVIAWDDANPKDKDTMRFAEALKKHDQIQCAGNYNLASAQFALTDSREIQLTRASNIKSMGQAFNLLNNMKESALVSAAFFVGVNPVGKTTEDIFIELCDFQDGVVMANAAEFLKNWSSPDSSHVVYANKAQKLGIIVNDSGTLKLNDEIIGSDTDDIVAYLKTNTDMYNFLKKSVEEKDTLPLGSTKDGIVSEVMNNTQKEVAALTNKQNPQDVAQKKADKKVEATKEADELSALKKEAQSLKVKGWQSPFVKAETLKIKIQEKKNELEKEKLAAVV